MSSAPLPQPFNLGQQSQLNPAPATSSSTAPLFEASGGEDPEWGEASSDSGNSDYYSSDSDADSDTVVTWAASWAVHNKNQKKFKKNKPPGTHKKPFDPSKKKKVGFKPKDPNRYKKDEPPKGMSKEDWEKRVPCPGCGS